jgi:hypothetical protein
VLNEEPCPHLEDREEDINIGISSSRVIVVHECPFRGKRYDFTKLNPLILIRNWFP